MKRLIFFLTIIPFFCFSQNTNSDNFSDELFFFFYNVELLHQVSVAMIPDAVELFDFQTSALDFETISVSVVISVSVAMIPDAVEVVDFQTSVLDFETFLVIAVLFAAVSDDF